MLPSLGTRLSALIPGAVSSAAVQGTVPSQAVSGSMPALGAAACPRATVVLSLQYRDRALKSPACWEAWFSISVL